MSIRWTTAFLDSTEEHFEKRVAFWCDITRSKLSERRGQAGEFVTLVPPNGDAYLRVQRTREESGGLHLDLHTDDVDGLVQRATGLGATVIADHGYQVLESPGGFVFCVVRWHGETIRTSPTGSPPALIDQLSIDIPFDLYDPECLFWASLTQWALSTSRREEFSFLARPTGIPLRFLLQQLGPSDTRTRVTAHIDIACGSQIGDLAEQHREFGATVCAHHQLWSTLQDPAGFSYCLTSRDPHTGTLR